MGPSGGDLIWMSTCPPSLWATPDPGSGSSGPGPFFTTAGKDQGLSGARSQEERSVAVLQRSNLNHHHLGKSARKRCDPRPQDKLNKKRMSGEKLKVFTKKHKNRKMLDFFCVILDYVYSDPLTQANQCYRIQFYFSCKTSVSSELVAGVEGKFEGKSDLNGDSKEKEKAVSDDPLLFKRPGIQDHRSNLVEDMRDENLRKTSKEAEPDGPLLPNFTQRSNLVEDMRDENLRKTSKEAEPDGPLLPNFTQRSNLDEDMRDENPRKTSNEAEPDGPLLPNFTQCPESHNTSEVSPNSVNNQCKKLNSLTSSTNLQIALSSPISKWNSVNNINQYFKINYQKSNINSVLETKERITMAANRNGFMVRSFQYVSVMYNETYNCVILVSFKKLKELNCYNSLARWVVCPVMTIMPFYAVNAKSKNNLGTKASFKKLKELNCYTALARWVVCPVMITMPFYAVNAKFKNNLGMKKKYFSNFPLFGVCVAKGNGRVRVGRNESCRNRGLEAGMRIMIGYRSEVDELRRKKQLSPIRNMAVEVSNASKNLKFPFMTVCVCLARLRRKDQSHRQMALGAGEVFQNLDFWGAIWCLPPALKRRLVEVGACLLYTSPSPRDLSTSRMPSSA